MENHIKFKTDYWIVLVGALINFGGLATAKPKQVQDPDKPNNIVLIYIDDLGYSDLGCYGQDFGMNFNESPNIDRFASRSLKFTRAYSASSICSPSRAALLTGKSPARLNFEFVTKFENEQYQWSDSLWVSKFKDQKLTPPPYTLNLPLEEYTIAEMLQSQGYETAMVGKWHVSSHHNIYNGWNPDFGPTKQGFEWAKNTFGAWDKNNKKAKVKTAQGVFPVDSLTDAAVDFINKDHKRPFFLYVSHYYVHTPLDRDLKWLLNKYKEKAQKLNLIVSEERIRYAAFVETMDHYVAQVLQAIEDKGLTDNTTIIFTSDNGGMPKFAYNRPFRGSKWNLYEGGIRVPLIIHYPNGHVNKGVNDVPVSQMDFMPTFYEMACGKKYEDENSDGISLLPLLKEGNDQNVKGRQMIWHFPYYHPEGASFESAPTQIGVEDEYISQTRPHSAIQKDGMKLLFYYEDSKAELYDLTKDPKESTDLSNRYPHKVKNMEEDLFKYLNRVNTRLPRKNNYLLQK